MIRNIELFGEEKIIGLASVIPDSNDNIVKIGALDLNYLEKLIKEIKKRDPCKRGEVRKYTIGYRVNADRDGVPDNWIGHIVLLQKRGEEEKNVYYAIAPILIEKEDD
jgi:hypothetical protein